MLSKKCQYALHALIHIVKNEKPYTCVFEISEQKKIPRKFLEVIFLDLKNAGILGSKKGKGGGFYFRKNPETVNLYDIIEIIDGSLEMIPCASLNFKRCWLCNQEYACPLRKIFSKVHEETLKSLNATTLRDLVNDQSIMIDEALY